MKNICSPYKDIFLLFHVKHDKKRRSIDRLFDFLFDYLMVVLPFI